MFPHQNVQIMGSFDGWSQGEAMSMEYSGDYGRFSATLKLRPGRLVLLVFPCWSACFLHVNKLAVCPWKVWDQVFGWWGMETITWISHRWRWNDAEQYSYCGVTELSHVTFQSSKQCRRVPSCLLPSVTLCYHVVASQKSMFVEMQGSTCISVFFIVTYSPFVFKYMTNKSAYPEHRIFKNGANTGARSQWFVLFYALD